MKTIGPSFRIPHGTRTVDEDRIDLEQPGFEVLTKRKVVAEYKVSDLPEVVSVQEILSRNLQRCRDGHLVADSARDNSSEVLHAINLRNRQYYGAA